MRIWEGFGSSIVAAAVGALVAVLAVHLSNVAARRSWYHQRRIEAFAQVLDGWHQCWDVASRNWDSYPRREPPHGEVSEAAGPEWSPLEDVLDRRDGDLLQAVNTTHSAVGAWALYLDDSGKEIEAATRRALELLYGEWDYSGHLEKGSLMMWIGEPFMSDWDRYLDLSRRWHRAHSKRAKSPISKELRSMWRSEPKTKQDIAEELGHARRFFVE
ncbi:hypothetical protein LG284_16425 (plasmid) [Citricoccus nitrophenolicus]